jgi:hypothetical protein
MSSDFGMNHVLVIFADDVKMSMRMQNALRGCAVAVRV